MNSLIIPKRYQYIGVFLTMACNYHCSYCINSFGLKSRSSFMGYTGEKRLNASEWIEGLNRIRSFEGDLEIPITIQGGEPSLHSLFYEIINGIKPELKIDLLTNLTFDVFEFVKKVNPDRLKRESPYASIRVSYHPSQVEFKDLLDKVSFLKSLGYSIGIWAVDYPPVSLKIKTAKEIAIDRGVDFRIKEYLGEYENKLYGKYKYSDACRGYSIQDGIKFCRTSELIINPQGDIFRCHSDLYKREFPIGNILNPDFVINDVFRGCNKYGFCNPCDIKIKNNYKQEFGYTSVEIKKSLIQGELYD